MKKLSIMTALSATILLSACGSEPAKPAAKPAAQPVAAAPVYDCVFPNTNQPAPGWICDEPVPGIAVSAVGIAEPSKAGISYMKDMAAADARGRLAEQMKVKVAKMVKKYLGTTGVASTETLDAAASSTIKTISSQTLVGSKVYKTRTGPNGKLYALVGMDTKAAVDATKKAVQTSMNHNKAMWQQFQAKKSFDEMAAGIANQVAQ